MNQFKVLFYKDNFMKINIIEMNEYLPNEIDYFICVFGNSERWGNILLNTNCVKSNNLIIINDFDNIYKSRTLPDLIKDLSDKVEMVDVYDDNPVKQWNNLYHKVVHFIRISEGCCVVDITNFSKDLIYNIIYQIKYLSISHKVKFVYSAADRYSVSVDLVSDYRISSVLGYSGNNKISSNKSHLMILVGFDFNLAINLINELEPSSISLGVGIDAFNSDFYQQNIKIRDEIISYLTLNYTSTKISIFDFSSSDCNKAKKLITNESIKYENVILCALNTKISTVAAALAAMEHNIRICHIDPIFSEEINYSTSSDIVSLFEI